MTKSARRRRIRKEKSKAAAASFRLYYADEPVPVKENDSHQNNCVSEVPTIFEPSPIISESIEESAPVSKCIPAPAPNVLIPPTDMQLIIDKMASYVAKNGRDFEDVVKAKGRFFVVLF